MRIAANEKCNWIRRDFLLPCHFNGAFSNQSETQFQPENGREWVGDSMNEWEWEIGGKRKEKRLKIAICMKLLAIKIAYYFFICMNLNCFPCDRIFVGTLISHAWNGWFSVCICLRSHSYGLLAQIQSLVFVVHRSLKPEYYSGAGA